MRILLVPALAAAFLASPALAQPVADADVKALSQCVVLKSTGADRQTLVRWMLGSLASSSLATGMVKVDPAAKEVADRAIAAVFARLLTVDCLNEVKAVNTSSGSAGIKAAFSAFGAIAMHDSMEDQSVNAALGAFVQFIPPDALKKLEP